MFTGKVLKFGKKDLKEVEIKLRSTRNTILVTLKKIQPV